MCHLYPRVERDDPKYIIDPSEVRPTTLLLSKISIIYSSLNANQYSNTTYARVLHSEKRYCWDDDLLLRTPELSQDIYG